MGAKNWEVGSWAMVDGRWGAWPVRRLHSKAHKSHFLERKCCFICAARGGLYRKMYEKISLSVRFAVSAVDLWIRRA